jgi:hopanoid biosynthesis associated protein HpnK
VRRLIINADDFGLTSGVNQGIIKAHRQGIVTSSTLMACGAQFSDAVRLAAENSQLSVGCHVLLVDGRPVLDPQNISTLLSNSGSHFRQSIVSFAARAATGRLDQDHIEAEVTAQIQKLQRAGIHVSHVDSHKHTHMFPVVLRGILRAAQKCGVRAIRNPFEPLVFAASGSWKRQFQLGTLRRYRGIFRQELEKAEMVTPDGCIGIVATGGLTARIFDSLIQSLPEGTWEFVSHPGYNDSDLGQVATRLRQSREKELEILTRPGLRKTLEDCGIQLISYRDLANFLT